MEEVELVSENVESPVQDENSSVKTVPTDNSSSTEGSKTVPQERFWRSKVILNEDPSNATENIPFVKTLGNHKNKAHFLPEGFQISARVVSSAEDGLSYFSPVKSEDQGSSTDIQIPYQECSSVGITTPPINLRHLTFRHLPPAGAHPAWSNTGPTPQLVICLHPLQITVSGNNEKRVFKAGEVILLEDVHSRGHKMTAVEDSSTSDDLSVLILTLPHPPKHKQTWNHHHANNKATSAADSKKPCKLEDTLPYFIPPHGTYAASEKSKRLSFAEQVKNMEIDVRRALLTTAGILSSSALTYFLGKVAPPVLAVVFGGGCVVVGGTCMVVKTGESIMYQMDERSKRRRLEEVLSKLDPEEELNGGAS